MQREQSKQKCFEKGDCDERKNSYCHSGSAGCFHGKQCLAAVRTGKPGWTERKNVRLMVWVAIGRSSQKTQERVASKDL